MTQRRRGVFVVLAALAGLVSACSGDRSGGEAAAAATTPAAEVEGPVTGGRGVPFNAMPAALAEEHGYTETEFFVVGEARRFEPAGSLGRDGRWAARAASETAPYRVRILVRRPIEAGRFNGTVVVEWLNVSAGRDADPDFALLHDEILRAGYAYVGVSAQAAGVNGDGPVLPLPEVEPLPLRVADPERYESLDHPGDDYSYDVFAQVGATLRMPNGVDPLDGLRPRAVVAVGESQSAARLTTFVNAVHPLTEVFDGYLVHSRGAGGAPLDSATFDEQPDHTGIRTDLDVPVLQVETETDLVLLGFDQARQPDDDSVRTWEVAGTAHADRELLDYAVASGRRGHADAAIDLAAGCGAINAGLQGMVLRRALDALQSWVVDGEAPPSAETLELVDGGLARDDHGIALGGVRSPAVDAPAAVLSGEPRRAGDPACRAFGATLALDDDTLADLYPTHRDYVTAVEEAAADAVAADHLLPADAEVVVAEAEAASVP